MHKLEDFRADGAAVEVAINELQAAIRESASRVA